MIKHYRKLDKDFFADALQNLCSCTKFGTYMYRTRCMYVNEKEENSLENSSFVPLCKSLTDYRTASLCQTGRNKHISAMLLKEFESATNFKEDFFKVVEFLHYLEDEGYDMKTFERVKRNQ